MHAMEILRDTLTRGHCVVHKRRLHALLQAVAAALKARSHTLSELARALSANTAVRHRVKCIDRLLDNTALRRECAGIYGALAAQILNGCSQPVILIDGSDLKADRSVQMTRASIAWHGRSLNVLQQVLVHAGAPERRCLGGTVCPAHAHRAGVSRYQERAAWAGSGAQWHARA